MERTTLAEYVRTLGANGQTETARRAGLTPGAIWQMLRSDRRIYVTENDDGTVDLEEVKAIGRNNAA